MNKQGLRTHFFPTTKFKTTTISIRFLVPLKDHDASINAMLSQSLVDRCEKYPTKEHFANALDVLYGAGVGSSINGFGQAQTLELRFKFMNSRFAFSKEEYEQDMINFIKELVFSPLLSEDVFNEGKKVLLAKIQRMLDDPQSYANDRVMKIAGKGTSVAISNYGELATVENITLEDFKAGYQKLINESMIDVIVVGNVSDTFKAALEDLPFTPRTTTVETCQVVNLEKLGEVVEHKQIPQSVIQVVYQANIGVQDANYMKARIMNAMLGVFPTSLLFQEVREKHSLCYSIYSSLIGFDGILQISTGIKDENIEKTITLIKEQVERLKSGDFEDELLEVTKMMMKNTFKGIKDDPTATINIQYQTILSGVSLFDETTMHLIDEIVKEDIVAMANQLEPIVTYVLTKDETYGKTL